MSEYTYQHIPGGTHYWLLCDGSPVGIVDKKDEQTATHLCWAKGRTQQQIDAAMAAVKELQTHSNPPLNVGFDADEEDDDE